MMNKLFGIYRAYCNILPKVY